MRKLALFLLASALWFGSNSVALADGMLLPLPEALIPDYLAVRYHHVTVRIEDGHAVTRVEQEFYNPHDIPVDGRYLFPVPPEAILSRFEVTVDGQRQQAIRQDVAETNAALHAVISQQHDPSLLQYADWQSLALDLNLAPGGSKRMTLEYEEVLLPSGGLYRYRYVLSTERYSSLPLEEVSVVVELKSSAGLASLYSSSHDVTIERLGWGRARVHWKSFDANPTEDFELFFSPAENGFGSGLLAGERDGQGHFLFLFSPEARPHRSDALPKDIVFVLDRSGSMDGEKIEQARNALHYILGQLGEEDRFCLISFNDEVSVLHYYLQPAEKAALQDARRYLDGVSADAGTDLESALQSSLEILLGAEERGATRMVVFLTDGLPTAGVTDENLIAQLVARTNTATNARLHVFGVGYDVNSRLLDRLAADSNGTVTYVRPSENLELALTEFYGKIAHPVLTDIEVAFEGLEADSLYPATLPDLFQGSSILLTGRYQPAGKAATVMVRGRAGEELREYVYHYDLEEAGNHDFVPRLWATRRVGALLDRVRMEGWSQALEGEIRELGLSYGIVTPYTTFVIEGQATGAASADNMALYGSAELNQASGQVAIDARVQNQAYQQAAQASQASGANVVNYGQQSLVQVGTQQLDLSLLRGRKDLEGPITDDWVQRNIQADRTVEFGSEEYFALAADPQARVHLQSGRNVVFAYQGQVIAVQDPDYRVPETKDQLVLGKVQAAVPDRESDSMHLAGLALAAWPQWPSVLVRLLPVVVLSLLLALVTVMVAAWTVVRPRSQ